MIITTLDLLRHGEVQGGACYRGSTDDPLTEYGVQQMRKAVAGRDDWQLIVSSPLCRCLDFAKELSQEKKLPLIVEAGFQEIHFGDWEGKNAEQINPDALSRFYEQPLNYQPPNGESLSEFQNRIAKAWQQVLQHQQGQSILIITHAGVMRILCCLVLQIPLEKSFALQVDHASFTRFSCFHSDSGDFTRLEFHNRLK